MTGTLERNDYIEESKLFFKRIWQGKKPIVKLYKTQSADYLYDTGTNKVLKCKPNVFFLLECLFSTEMDKAIAIFLSRFQEGEFIDAVEKIKVAVEKEGVLLSFGANQFGLSSHYGNLKDLLDSKLSQLTLEVTERCPMRCLYCPYNYSFEYSRNHGERDMSLEVAFKAIDYLKTHSYKSDRRAVTFYGGEPLLRFDFIQSCVEYTKSVFSKTSVDFNITTNGILITQEIANYFFKNNFPVVISIDGPKDIHDSYRKDTHGNGTFNRVVNGLKTLVDTYGDEAANKIILSMVYTPPYSGERIDRIAALWDELPWLPKNLNVNITYPSEGTMPAGILSTENVKEEKDLERWGIETFEKKYSGTGEGHPISDSMEEKKLAMFMQRTIFHEPFDKYYLNGCCVPGLRKIFVTVDGAFRICEKISSKAPLIGNVFEGFTLETIQKAYIDEYEQMSLPLCSKCWAIRLCNICYVQTFRTGKFDIDSKCRSCRGQLHSKSRLLKLFSILMEKNPDGLNFLYDVKLE